MFFHLSFVTLILALSAFGTSIKRDAAQVERDIQNLYAQTNSLDTTINAFPNTGGTLEQTLVVQKAATELKSAIQNATADASSSPTFTDSEANTIIGQSKNLVTIIEKTLDDLDDKKPAFAGLKVDGLVEYDLKQLQNATGTFGAVFVSKMPESMKNTAQGQVDAINDAFQKATEAYSS